MVKTITLLKTGIKVSNLIQDIMKYAAFFSSLAIAILYWFSISHGLFLWLLIYPLLNCIILFVAYLLNWPSLILGKTATGQINSLLLLVNLPWLLLTWVIWVIEAIASSEAQINRIDSTNIYVGRYPYLTQTKQFDWVIDLTAEFLPCKTVAKQYICLSNLDGIPLRNTNHPPHLSPNQKILIHCAQGHGRSATYAALLMSQLLPNTSPQQALSLVLESRPGAKPSKAQLSQLRCR